MDVEPVSRLVHHGVGWDGEGAETKPSGAERTVFGRERRLPLAKPTAHDTRPQAESPVARLLRVVGTGGRLQRLRTSCRASACQTALTSYSGIYLKEQKCPSSCRV